MSGKILLDMQLAEAVKAVWECNKEKGTAGKKLLLNLTWNSPKGLCETPTLIGKRFFGLMRQKLNSMFGRNIHAYIHLYLYISQV